MIRQPARIPNRNNTFSWRGVQPMGCSSVVCRGLQRKIACQYKNFPSWLAVAVVVSIRPRRLRQGRRQGRRKGGRSAAADLAGRRAHGAQQRARPPGRRSPVRSSRSAAPTCAPKCPAVVLAVLKENGDPVQARRPARAPRRHLDPRQPHCRARPPTRAAAQAYEQAERQFQRMKTLRETGVVSDAAARRRRDPPQHRAERSRGRARRASSPRASSSSAPKCARRSTASSATARCRRATPRRSARSCSRSSIRRSLRFEGLVSADSIGEVKAGPARRGSASTASRDQRIHRQDHARESGGQRHHAPGRSAGELRRREAAAERGRPVRRRAASRPQHRGADSSRASRWCAKATTPSPGA